LSTRISASNRKFPTLIDLLRWRADQQPEQRIYTFLTDGESENNFFTYAELDRQARIIGAALQEHIASGERALLIYPSGLEFIAAFFGCLYSGIIAVPVYPPTAARSDRTLVKFRAIARDAQPQIILTASTFHSKVEGLLAQSPELQGVRLLTTDQLPDQPEARWQAPGATEGTLAFLQYTSGSTGTPKGVMISHGNLLHNSSMVERFCEHPDQASGMTWLPLYHDLGLIGGVLQPLYAGYESTIMTPASFLQRPLRWLEAITRTRATISGGPNFAYDLCVRKITEEQKARLDLSSWEIVANGAEPVHAETLERFAKAFASCGFRRAYSYPCYGLAEATLVVSAGKKGTFPTVETFQAEALEQNEVRENVPGERETAALVSIGNNQPDQRVIIVNPETLTECAANRVGELWVAGPSVASGYWQRPTETEEIFHAYLADTGEGPFLRTGDLGFRHKGELFLAGRLKDLIIIRGTNHYPQDIEQTVAQCHPAMRSPSGCAAFSIEAEGEERLVVVQEIERTYLSRNLDEVIAAARRAIAEQHDLQVYALVLIKPASLPKTSSGKVQRRGTREAYLEGSLAVVREWKLDVPSVPEPTVSQDLAAASQVEDAQSVAKTNAAPPPGKSVADIQSWLITHLAQELKVSQRELGLRTPFAQYGMDSVQAVMLSADLEDWLGYQLSPALLFDYPNIETLAHHLGPKDDAPAVSLGVEASSADRVPALENHPPSSDHNAPNDRDAIAIVALGCRFPGADGPDAFWQFLHEGVDGISEVPARRWDLEKYYAPDQAVPGKMNTRWGGFVKGIELFDPYFFGISPREASRMDPQQRLLLEVAWETLEFAGIAPEKLAGSSTGVFVGISSNDYSALQASDPRYLDAYAGTGNAHSIAANRLSYVFDLRGPSMAIDTACSSSLVAVHQACQALRSGECDLAFAGGVNVIISPDLTITFSQARMMSSVGRCHTFDESADGYVRGEGCGLVLLKPLVAAQQDGDQILAVIRGSAVNQDGRSNGLTAPNGPSQEAVIRQALSAAHITPDQVSYVETHGSSTPLGDPIEVDSLKAVLMGQRTPDQLCLLGSVKTNIGHLEAAAGIAGLIKTVLSLHRGEIVPHLHFKKLNRHISFEGTTFAIPTTPRPWPDLPRRIAGVSAFGFGGTNAHIVLEAAPTPVLIANPIERPMHVLTLSGQTTQSLSAHAQRYMQFLGLHPEAALADISFTANRGRTHFAHRLAVTAASREQLRERLAAFIAGKPGQGVQQGHAIPQQQPRLAFLFTGQGAQYIGMARRLYETQPTFRRALDRCDEILRAYLERPLLSVIYPAAGAESPLDETAYTQPALFALEYALTELWRSWGVTPDIVMGHSVGEYVAAYLAGVFSLEDALKLVAARGRLMQALPQDGDMVVVFAEPERVLPMLAAYRDQVSIAAINGPQNTTLSGARSALRTIVEQLEAEGLTTHPMTVSHAFHSPLIEPMLDGFEQIAREVTHRPLRIPLVSNLTGGILTVGETLDASYWRRQTRGAVRFLDSVQSLVAEGYELFVEVGPHSVLSSMGKRCLPANQGTWLPSLRKGQDDWQVFLESGAALYLSGRVLDWAGFEQDYARRRLALPSYPFEREVCWFDAEEFSEIVNSDKKQPITETVDTDVSTKPRSSVPVATLEGPRRHPLLDEHMALVHPAQVHIWETALDRQRLPYLSDHRIQGAMALPVSAYIEMAQAATEEALGPGTYVLADLELKKLLLLPEKGSQRVQVILSSDANELASFHVYSHTAGVPDQPRAAWTLHATGKIQARA
jgi:acyl transferase domain-containing protein/acyl-CoA synthetase (AMP-forming)/AMP-acid ligase II/acyl carrier protein